MHFPWACYSLWYIAFDIVSDIECLHKIIFTLGNVFKWFWKNLIFSKTYDIFFYLDGCLQPCGLVNVLKVSKGAKISNQYNQVPHLTLYKMNKNSIKGFVTNYEIFLSLWPLHENGSLSNTRISLPEPKNFRGVLNLKTIFPMTKYLIKHPVVYFLSSVSTLKHSSEMYVIRTHYN